MMDEKGVQKRIVRFIETNIDGRLSVENALRRVRGMSFMFSNAVVNVSGLGGKIFGELSDEEIKKLEDIVLNPKKHGIPEWLYNRRSDPFDGKNKHLTASSLELTQKIDINEMKKLKSYRGVRHILGLPVRGQRTRSTFRKGKTIGVKRKKQGGA